MKNHPKKVLECVWGYFGWVLTMFPDGFGALWALSTPIWVVGHLLNPSSLQGGFGDLAILGGFGVNNHPKKKVSECVWGYFGGVLTMFPDGFDAFWALWTPIWLRVAYWSIYNILTILGELVRTIGKFHAY